MSNTCHGMCHMSELDTRAVQSSRRRQLRKSIFITILRGSVCCFFYLQGQGMSSKVHLVTHSQMLLTTLYFSIDTFKALANTEADPAGAV